MEFGSGHWINKTFDDRMAKLLFVIRGGGLEEAVKKATFFFFSFFTVNAV